MNKPLKEEIPCPICDSRRYRVLYEPWKDVQNPVALYGATSGVQGTQRLVTCLDCGVIYENPRYSPQVILEGYRSYAQETHDSQHPMRVDSFYRALVGMRKYLPSAGAHVLDVGTAGGAFLEAAQRFGYHAVGLEPSEFMVEQGKQRGLNILQGTLADDLFSEHSFDMICFWDVLEHLPFPKEELLRARRLLKPDGILLINYPDIGTWMAKLAGRHFWWLLSVHLVHFSQKSIRKLCELTGFQAYHFEPYWQTLQFGYLEDMAIHLRLPLSRVAKRLTPLKVQTIAVPYYASQTTALARLKPNG